jgi:ATP-binding cassette, subfamily F, member 3
MIQLRDITLSFGEQIIFNKVSTIFGGKQRIGVVGRNGAGKSTLLKIIAGLHQVDDGSVSIERYKTIAYMPQEMVVQSLKNVFDEACTVFQEFIELEQEKVRLEELLPQSPPDIENLLERYSFVQEKVANFDLSAARARTLLILKGLGFSAAQLEQGVNELSLGWRMRLVLAKLLLQNADFYLFDEPTNHLDIVAQEWFFDFLRQADFGFLLVSHDRYYLERACTHILELERGRGNLYTGNFSTYMQLKEQQRAITESTAARQQKEIARKQATIDRFKASASRATMAQSMAKQLERIELVEVEPPLPTIKLNFPPVQKSGAVPLVVKNVSKRFEERTIFSDVHLEVKRGEKVALVAPNGVGKTTLFNIITGKYTLETGTITFGHNVQSAVFEQDQLQVLDPQKTVFQEVCDACPQVTEQAIRSLLGSFLFSADDVHKKIAVLSGGERNRVAMVKVLLQKANMLLLDEPTNHLDLYAKEILLKALQNYDGTLLFVSHDHDFIEKIATRIIELTPQGLHSYLGTYESYREQKKAEIAAHAPQSHKTTSAPQQTQKAPLSNDSAVLKRQISGIESKIARYEKTIATINARFETCVYGSPEYAKIVEQLNATQKSLQEEMARWEEIQSKLSEVQS